MIVTSIETITGYRIVKHLGLVQGSTVRSKHAGKDILAGLKNIVGGELTAWTRLWEESRSEGFELMKTQASSSGGTEVLNVGLATSAVTAGEA